MAGQGSNRSVTGEKDSAVRKANNEQFKELVGQIANDLDQLWNLAKVVGSAERGQKVNVQGLQVGQRELNTMKTALRNRIERLYTPFRAANKQTKRAPRRGQNAVGGTFFTRLSQFDEPLLAFFRTADLGTFQGQPLQTFLPFLQAGNGVTLQGVVNTLFRLYAKRHNLVGRATSNQGKIPNPSKGKRNPALHIDGRQVGADQRMTDMLGEGGSWNRVRQVVKGQFNPNDFNAAQFASIIRAYTVNGPDGSPANIAPITRGTPEFELATALGDQIKRAQATVVNAQTKQTAEEQTGFYQGLINQIPRDAAGNFQFPNLAATLGGYETQLFVSQINDQTPSPSGSQAQRRRGRAAAAAGAQLAPQQVVPVGTNGRRPSQSSAGRRV